MPKTANLLDVRIQPLKAIFQKAIESVQPHKMIPAHIHLTNSHLVAGARTFPLSSSSCHIVGFGKAVLGMALHLERLLAHHLRSGVVLVPFLPPTTSPSRLQFFAAAKDNLPDLPALEGALRVAHLARSLTSSDLLFVLVSGGGSALLPAPAPPTSLDEKQALIRRLSLAGADIFELNCVRKQLSTLKGGGLAALAHPAQVVALILSDVVGDPLDIIASGPTVPNRDQTTDAIEVLNKYKCYNSLPDSIRHVLTEKLNTQHVHQPTFDHVLNLIIGNNQIAAEAAKQHADTLGFQSALLSTTIKGDVNEIATIYAELARYLDLIASDQCSKSELQTWSETLKLELNLTGVEEFDFGKEFCLVLAGEPTVVVQGNGKGGRNQQLALDFSLQLKQLKALDVVFLSGGTDGIDGPTDAAGAIGTADLVDVCLGEKLSPEDYLRNNDAYSFYSLHRSGQLLLRTGHTGTNVMDIHVLAFYPKRC